MRGELVGAALAATTVWGSRTCTGQAYKDAWDFWGLYLPWNYCSRSLVQQRA